MLPRHNLSFCACKTAWLAPEIQVSMGPSPYLWFCIQNSDIFYQNYKSLCSQTSLVVLCMQNSVIWTRIKSYMGSIPHLWFCVCKTATLGLELQVSVGPRPHLSFRASKIAWLASQSLISIGPWTHLWCFDAKQWLLDQNNKSLCVHLSFCACNASVISTRITCLYRSQIWSVVFACKTATFGPE